MKSRRLAIVGSRDIDEEYAFEILEDFVPITYADSLVSGGAKGADTLAYKYAIQSRTPIAVHHPDWETHGKKAGFLRNKVIEENADMVLALWNGESKGTRHTINMFLNAGKDTFVYIVPKERKK